MSEKETIEERILKVYYTMGIDTKDDVSPTRVSLDFTEHEDSAMRRAYWYVEEEVLIISATDASLDSFLKSFTTKCAWLSKGKKKYTPVMVLMLILVISPVFIWRAGGSYLLLITISFTAFISFPFVWYWAFKNSKFMETEIKLQMLEAQVIFSEEEIEEYYNSLTFSSWRNWLWAEVLVLPEILSLIFIVLFMSGI